MRDKQVYQEIAALSAAIENCKARGNYEWLARHEERLSWVINQFLPSGSGIDSGTKLIEASDKKIVLQADFHHMDQNGYYDGWTEHTVVVRPAWQGIDIKITGRNRNDIKDYLGDVFHDALTRTCARYGENGLEYGWWTHDGEWIAKGTK